MRENSRESMNMQITIAIKNKNDRAAFFLFNEKLQITHLTVFEIKLDFSFMNSFSVNIFELIKKLISLVSYHC